MLSDSMAVEAIQQSVLPITCRQRLPLQIFGCYQGEPQRILCAARVRATTGAVGYQCPVLNTFVAQFQSQICELLPLKLCALNRQVQIITFVFHHAQQGKACSVAIRLLPAGLASSMELHYSSKTQGTWNRAINWETEHIPAAVLHG